MSLIHSPEEIIGSLLVDQGKAVFDVREIEYPVWKWKLLINIMPDDPYKVLAIYGTQGIADGRSQESGEQFEHYGFSLMARAEDPPMCHNMLRILKDYFETVLRAEVVIPQQEIDGGTFIAAGTYRIHQITRTSPILSAGQDDKRRFMFSLNCMTSITQIV